MICSEQLSASSRVQLTPTLYTFTLCVGIALLLPAVTCARMTTVPVANGIASYSFDDAIQYKVSDPSEFAAFNDYVSGGLQQGLDVVKSTMHIETVYAPKLTDVINSRAISHAEQEACALIIIMRLPQTKAIDASTFSYSTSEAKAYFDAMDNSTRLINPTATSKRDLNYVIQYTASPQDFRRAMTMLIAHDGGLTAINIMLFYESQVQYLAAESRAMTNVFPSVTISPGYKLVPIVQQHARILSHMKWDKVIAAALIGAVIAIFKVFKKDNDQPLDADTNKTGGYH